MHLDYSPLSKPAADEHLGYFPKYPKGYVILRILQLVFSLIPLGLAAGTLHLAVFEGNIAAIVTVRSPSQKEDYIKKKRKQKEKKKRIGVG